MEADRPPSCGNNSDRDFHLDCRWVIDNFNLKEEVVQAIYLYGSRVYGTATEKSDWDYLVIVKYEHEETTVKGKDEQCDATIVGEKQFCAQLEEHNIKSLECLWLPPGKVTIEKLSLLIVENKTDKILLNKTNYAFVVNLQKLREYVSWRAGHR